MQDLFGSGGIHLNLASVVAVWTVALDPNGGPIQPGNNCGGCRGLVTIDEQSHIMTDDHIRLAFSVPPGRQRAALGADAAGCKRGVGTADRSYGALP